MMCKNVNECDINNPTHNCNIEAKCYDEIGYFACICNDGYHGDGFGENGCIDIDECSTGVHTCVWVVKWIASAGCNRNITQFYFPEDRISKNWCQELAISQQTQFNFESILQP